MIKDYSIMFFTSPLAQFDMVSVFPFYMGMFTITNGIFILMFVILCYSILQYFFFSEVYLVPSIWQLSFEFLFLFLYSIVFKQLGKEGLKFLPFVITIFVFILTLNLYSLLPYSFALTTHMVCTLLFTSSILFGLLILGFYLHKKRFFLFFVPNVPKALYVLMIPIEILSYFIRALSLGVRLSANILAGHTLVHIMADLIQGVGLFNLDLSILGIILLCGIMLMELGVACLQAYIFTLLIVIYINDIYNFTEH